MIREDEVVHIGRLGKPHGVKGEMTFTFNTDVWDRVEAEYLILLVDGIWTPFFLEEYRFRTDSSALLKFRGVDNIDDAQELCGVDVYFPKQLLPEDGEAEYTWKYFEGFRLRDYKVGDLGKIIRADDSTQNVLFELQSGRLIPAVEDFISEIDHDKGMIYMQLPDGLLDLN